MLNALFSLSLLAGVATAEPPAQVMIVGTYHFSNPGHDQHNVQADDVLTAERQKQLEAIATALARFEPTRVAVEWDAKTVDERYPKYRAGELAPSRNEVVQLGFRLAKRLGLERVDGIDVDGDFPYEPVAAWAQAHGATAKLDAAHARIQARVEATTKLQRDGTIAAALKDMNAPATIDADYAFYAELMRYGDGDEQPGAKLLAAWTARNLEICARLVQALEPGDRAVVFYGSGHSYLLRRCVRETPGLKLVEANAFLPN
jgi:hypothetical protein